LEPKWGRNHASSPRCAASRRCRSGSEMPNASMARLIADSASAAPTVPRYSPFLRITVMRHVGSGFGWRAIDLALRLIAAMRRQDVRWLYGMPLHDQGSLFGFCQLIPPGRVVDRVLRRFRLRACGKWAVIPDEGDVPERSP